MKKVIVILVVILGFSQLQAQDQDKENHRERIKALKTAFLTQELELSNKVAQEFWPIYNDYEAQKKELHHREHVELDNPQCYSENSAEELLQEFLDVEKEEYLIKKQLYANLKEIISAQEILKLHKLEDEFHKKLIKEYRSKKSNKK